MKLELRSVRIKNIGPIDDIKVDFFDAKGKTLPVCVIGGANGSGKTTVLEVIASLAEILSTGKAGAFLRSKPDGYAQADLLIDGNDFSTFFGTSPGDAELKKEHCGERAEGFTFVSTPLYADLHQRIGSQQGNPSPWRLSGTYWAVNDFVPSFIYLPHSRSLEPVSSQQIHTANRHEHSLHELSSGERNLLIIFTELRSKLLPGSVVLIDEIENSLHPAYQHRLAQGLLALQREAPYQLIVTTHAPAFVEIFGEENTRILTPF